MPILIGGQTSIPLFRNPQTGEEVRSVIHQIEKRLGDADDAAGNVTGVTFPSTTLAGQPVYVSGNNAVSPADADTVATSRVVGLASRDVLAGGTGGFTMGGVVELADWTDVTGSATLTAAAQYFLSSTAGQLTTTPPTAVGKVVVQVGIALSTTRLAVEIDTGILL